MKKSYVYCIGNAAIILSLLAFIPAVRVHADEEDSGMMDDAMEEHMDQSMGMEHRSNVADVVDELSKIASKDHNIGDDVSTVAREQKELGDETTQAMDAVDHRPEFLVFLIGSDYKNLGVLRSSLVTTDNHIDRLTRALNKSTNPSVKEDLQAQIDALKVQQSNLSQFITDNESKFSLFGWLNKLFAK